MKEDHDLLEMITNLLTLDQQGAGDVQITPQTPLADGGLQLTSLDLVRLFVNLEEQFGIELDDDDIMNAHLATVEDIIALLRGSLSTSPA